MCPPVKVTREFFGGRNEVRSAVKSTTAKTDIGFGADGTHLPDCLFSFFFVYTPLERSGGLFTKTTGIINLTHSAVNVIEECFLSLMRSI